MKKLLFSVIVAGFVSSAFAGGYQQQNYVPQKPAYNHGQYQHNSNRYPNRHHNYNYNHYYPRYNYSRDWVGPAIAGLAIGAVIGGATITYQAPVYQAPVYIEQPVPVRPSTAPQRLINGIVHELRYAYYDDCRCNRVTWVPIYSAY